MALVGAKVQSTLSHYGIQHAAIVCLSDRLPQSEGPQKLSTLNGHSPSPTVVLAARESGKNSDNVEYRNSFSIVSKGRNGSTILGLHHGIDCLRVVRLIIRFVHV